MSHRQLVGPFRREIDLDELAMLEVEVVNVEFRKSVIKAVVVDPAVFVPRLCLIRPENQPVCFLEFESVVVLQVRIH